MSASHQIGERFEWTPENVERLKALALEGHSCAQIAKALSTRICGPSRNAVLGKLNRLGVGLRNRSTGARPRPKAAIVAAKPTVEAPPGRAKPADKWKPYVEGSGDPKPPGMLLAERQRERFAAEAAIAAPADAKPIIELTLSACRWPVGQRDGQHVFCGRRSGEPFAYCAEHAPLRSSGRPLAVMKSEADDPFKRVRRRA